VRRSQAHGFGGVLDRSQPVSMFQERGLPMGSGPQSQWRIEFAREIAAVYSGRKGVRTIVLGGSPSRGLSDEYSDLDIVVYWDVMDREFISGAPLAGYGGKVGLQVSEPDGTIRMELYLFGTLIVEVGHTTVAEWEGMLDEVLVKNSFSPHDIKSIGGFRDALPLYAPGAYDGLRRRVALGPEDAEKVRYIHVAMADAVGGPLYRELLVVRERIDDRR